MRFDLDRELRENSLQIDTVSPSLLSTMIPLLCDIFSFNPIRSLRSQSRSHMLQYPLHSCDGHSTKMEKNTEKRKGIVRSEMKCSPNCLSYYFCLSFSLLQSVHLNHRPVQTDVTARIPKWSVPFKFTKSNLEEVAIIMIIISSE